MDEYDIVERSRAGKGVRFVEYLLDMVVFYILILISFALLGLLLAVTGWEWLDEFIESLNNLNTLVDRLFTIFLIVVYYALVESLTKGKTIGKIIMGTRVVTDDGFVPSTNQFLIRSISRIVPFDALSFFGSVGWHDKWSDTRVVKNKDLESNRIFLEIKEIGKGENLLLN